MSLGSWGYSLRQAVRSVSHGGLMSLASIGTVIITLLVLAVVALLAINGEVLARSVESQVEIRAFLKGDVTPAQGRALAEQIRRLPDVARAEFVTKQQALERMREQFKEHASLLAGLEEENPLPDAVEVRLKDAVATQRVADAVKQQPEVDEVKYARDMVQRLLQFTRAINLVGAGLVVLLMLTAVLIISNTIRLTVFARRREIGIMKLVGATDWFIRRPFVLEGILLGTVGAGLAMLAVAASYGWFFDQVRLGMPFLPLAAPTDVLADLAVGLLILGATVGASGSMMSLRRFLKV